MKPKYVVVHCSESPNNRVDLRLDSAGAIHQWHKERGWSGIGYHYVIDENANIHNGRPVFKDTKTFWEGAHTLGHNHESIAICLIGNDYFYPEQLKALFNQIHELLEIWPDLLVAGHNNLDSNRTCPNFDVIDWWLNGNEIGD